MTLQLKKGSAPAPGRSQRRPAFGPAMDEPALSGLLHVHRCSARGRAELPPGRARSPITGSARPHPGREPAPTPHSKSSLPAAWPQNPELRTKFFYPIIETKLELL
ncbi:MAG: hypothetical protein JWQ04_2119 [Pedosphaera sp.]|nr:hypothetical protein [Pedosphaera sp.]